MMCVKSFHSATMRAKTKLNPRLKRNCIATMGINMSHFHEMGSSGGIIRTSANMVRYVVDCRISSRTLIAMGSVILGKLNAVTSALFPEIDFEPVTTVVAGSKAISGNRALVTAFSFHRMTLPIAINVRELMRQSTTYLTMFALVLIIPPLEPISWKWLMFIPIVAMQFLFNLGLSFVLARIVAEWNDFTHIIAFGTRIWMYLSAIFYGVERFEDIPIVLNFMYANPLFCILDMTRDVVLYDTWPEPMRWIVLGGWTVGLLIVGTFIFWQGEEKYGRER